MGASGKRSDVLGCPIVVSDCVGCARDLVDPSRNGLVFAAGSVDALAMALKQALENDAQLQQWGKRSREIIQQYSYEQATAGLKQALTQLELR